MKLGCLLLSVVLMLAAIARAQTTNPRTQPAVAASSVAVSLSPRDQIQAALDNAVQTLRQQVRRVRLDRDLTVGQLVDRAEAEHDLVQTLSRAQQIGGPRWLDEQTCQVRVEIAGAAVEDSLRQIVKSRGDKSPVTLEYLNTHLGDLTKRRFSADGTSTSGESATLVRPMREADGWAAVSDENRKTAVCAARADASSKVIESIGSVPLAQGKTVKDVLAVKTVGDAVDKWLKQRPVTGLEFGPDLQVRVGLSTPADELFETFKAAATAQKNVPVPADAAMWGDVRRAFASKLGRITGSASAAQAARVVAAVQLPQEPPAWANQQFDAEGSGKSKSGQLKAARAAEAEALARLRTQVEGLHLNAGTTLGEAQKTDPRIKRAIDRALNQAKTYKVDYDQEGQKTSTAKVKVNLDLRELWDQIERLP